MPSFYRREIVQQALGIIWRKKYLWFLGFFAGLVAHGGEPDLLFRNINSVTFLKSGLVTLRSVIQSGDADQFMAALRRFVSNYPLNTLAYLAIIILMFAVIFWLIMVAQSAIVHIVGRTVQKKEATLFDGIAVGASKFWPMVVLNVITKLGAWALWIILGGLPAIYYFINGQSSWGVAAIIGSLLVTLPLAMIISFITKYAIGFITLNNEEPIEAVRRAWHMFRQNWLVSIELAVIIFVINIIVAYVVAGVAILTIQTLTNWTELTLLIMVLALIFAFVSTFSYAAWTIVYLKLLEGRAQSKIGQWAGRLVGLVEPKKSMS